MRRAAFRYERETGRNPSIVRGMPKVRAQIITRTSTDIPRDFITNTVHFDTKAFDINASLVTNWESIANDLRNMFRDTRNYIPAGYGVEVKVYDLDQPQPRPIKHHAPWVAYAQASGLGSPREVALCLSFRGNTSTKRTRGRIYVGPYNTTAGNERPTLAMQNNVLALATGLANIGSTNVDWCVRSTFPIVAGDMGGTMHEVQASWVDNEYDTVRSRGLRGTSRVTATHSE